MSENDYAERIAGNHFSSAPETQAQVISWLAAKLNERSEAGQLITAVTYAGLSEAIRCTAPFVAGSLSSPLRTLSRICDGIAVWLQARCAEDRPLSEPELQALAMHLCNIFAPELRSLAIRDQSAGQSHIPLFEGTLLTVNAHVWGSGGWTSDHDHGAAKGGIAILQGTLVEEIYTGSNWRTIERGHGQSYSFDYCIHRMGRPNGSGSQPISIHAYSGPKGGLTEVTSFNREADGSLTPIRSWHKGAQPHRSGCPCMLSQACGKEDSSHE
jgi:predicted metal-dependent enzyme (double-stranded beta helix superfamily)